MNIFKIKEKIDTVIFWKKKVEYLFSKKFDDAFQLFLETKKNLLLNVSRSLIKDHVVAAYIQLLNIAIGRNGASKKKRYEIYYIEKETIESYGGYKISDLLNEYNQQFGSSMSDGVRSMARHFTMSIKGEKDNELENFIYELFYGVLRDSFEELEKIKLN